MSQTQYLEPATSTSQGAGSAEKGGGCQTLENGPKLPQPGTSVNETKDTKPYPCLTGGPAAFMASQRF
jgi:hypothetical protein